MSDSESLDNFIKDVKSLSKGILCPGETLARDELETTIVSTIFANDIEQYETAIVDRNGIHPVERYAGKEEALIGHQKWVSNIPTLRVITKLGYGSFVPNETIVLSK